MTINVVTVTYGKRFVFLEKTLNAVISDKNVDKIIIIDNGSLNSNEIDTYIKNNQNKKIILIRNKENKGSASGFKNGILEARKNKSDYVLLLDDDIVMENNWSEYFLNILNYFPTKDNIIIKGNRGENFNTINTKLEKQEIFRINYFKKIKELFFKTNNTGIFQPIIYVPYGAFRYGGTLLPFKVIAEVETPFEPFYLYADDTEYFFRISQNGYKTYQTYRPMIEDIDHTFSNYSSSLMSFDKNVSLIKLFFMTRNQYALALMTKSQTKLSLILNGILGILLKIIYGFIKLGINKFTIERSKIIIRAFLDGVNLKFDNEINIKRYTR